MAPTATPIRDLLTSFNPASDFLALSSDDGHIKAWNWNPTLAILAKAAQLLLQLGYLDSLPLSQVWDAVRGHLQMEFADILAVEAGALHEGKRGHFALDYTCMKWVQLSNKATKHSLLQFGMCWCVHIMCLFFYLAEEMKGWEFAARAWGRQWGCPCA